MSGSSIKNELLTKGFRQVTTDPGRLDHVAELLERNGIQYVADLDGIDNLDFFELFPTDDFTSLEVAELHFLQGLAAGASAAGSAARAAGPASSGTTRGVAGGRATRQCVALQTELVLEVVSNKRKVAWDATGQGPSKAAKHLKRAFEGGLDRKEWLERARVAALVGNCE